MGETHFVKYEQMICPHYPRESWFAGDAKYSGICLQPILLDSLLNNNDFLCSVKTNLQAGSSMTRLCTGECPYNTCPSSCFGCLNYIAMLVLI